MHILLEKTREINRLLQNSDNISFTSMAEVLKEVLKANVYIVSRDGRLLGHDLMDNFECKIMIDKVINEKLFPKGYMKFVNGNTETYANKKLTKQMCAFSEGTKCMFNNKLTTIVPILGNGNRLGTLILARFDKDFDDGDLLLSEYAATVLGVQILHNKTIEIEEDARKRIMVQVAFSNLSYSELEAITAILNALDGNEGLLIASKIADEAGITRSVIVNALRKFESAGVLRTQSLGMKGTHVKILNEFVREGLKK